MNIRNIEEQTEENCRIAIRKAPDNFKYIVNPSEDIMRFAIETEPLNIKYIKDPSDEIKSIAVKGNGFSIKFIEDQTEELCFEAVSNCPRAYKFCKIQSDRIDRKAVSANGYNIFYTKNKTDEIFRIAVAESPYLLKFINNPSKNMWEFAANQMFKIASSLDIIKFMNICPYKEEFTYKFAWRYGFKFVKEKNILTVAEFLIMTGDEILDSDIFSKYTSVKDFKNALNNQDYDNVETIITRYARAIHDKNKTEIEIIENKISKNKSLAEDAQIKEILLFGNPNNTFKFDISIDNIPNYKFEAGMRVFSSKYGIELVDKKFLENNETRKMLLGISGDFIKFVENPSAEEKMIALKQNNKAIKYIKNQEEAECLYALQENEYVIEYVNICTDKILDMIGNSITCNEAVDYLIRFNKADKLCEFFKTTGRSILSYEDYLKLSNPSEELRHQFISFDKRNFFLLSGRTTNDEIAFVQSFKNSIYLFKDRKDLVKEALIYHEDLIEEDKKLITFFTDEEIKEMCSKNPKLALYLDKKFQTKDLCKILIYEDPEYIYRMKNQDPELRKIAINFIPSVVLRLKNPTLDEYIAAYKKDRSIIHYIEDETVTQYILASKMKKSKKSQKEIDISKKRIKSYNEIRDFIIMNYKNFNRLSIEEKTNVEVIEYCISVNYNVLEFVDETYKEKLNFTKIIKEAPVALKYVTNPSIDLCVLAVLMCPEALEFVPDNNLNDSLCELALSRNPSCIKFCRSYEKELFNKAEDEFVLSKYCENTTILNDYEIALNIAEKCPKRFEDLSKDLQMNISVIKKFICQDNIEYMLENGFFTTAKFSKDLIEFVSKETNLLAYLIEKDVKISEDLIKINILSGHSECFKYAEEYHEEYFEKIFSDSKLYGFNGTIPEDQILKAVKILDFKSLESLHSNQKFSRGLIRELAELGIFFKETKQTIGVERYEALNSFYGFSLTNCEY